MSESPHDSNNGLAFDDTAVAVVGMAGRFPGAPSLQAYWDLLAKGAESVTWFTDEQLIAAGEDPAALADPNYVRAQAVLEQFDHFDAEFWGFNPQDAAVTDPAHRLFLEVAYEAFEHAGHTGFAEEGPVAVFASSGASLYWMQNLQTNPELMHSMGEFLVRHTGNDMNFLATRLSYELDLRGPSVNVQTACSSALVACHYATQSLLSGECDFALAGASTVLLPQQRGYLFKEGEIMSPDGHCRPFDSKSAGTIFGSGAGCLLLRRYEDAVKDGDTIYAVVLGSAINNDGAQKVGFLAPGAQGQAAALTEALEVADVDPNDISYVEAHGTGTLVGDPIEFDALRQAYAGDSPCHVGSVKGNIGHLGEAAAAASLIKVILSMQHKQIPATVNYEQPNPELQLEDSRFKINNKLATWTAGSAARLAGITSLGAGGTNAHLVLQEAPLTDDPPTSQDQGSHLLVLSAKSEGALRSMRLRMAEFLRQNSDVALQDVAHTLQRGRRAYGWRFRVACTSIEEAIEALEQLASDAPTREPASTTEPELVFLLPGGGAQYRSMGRDLYLLEPTFKQHFEDCLSSLELDLASTVRDAVLDSDDTNSDDTNKGDTNKGEASESSSLEQPRTSLLALFTVEYSLARLYQSWGVEPTALIGHSMGENTAACLSGVLSLQDAVRLIETRGRLFEQVAGGGMLAVSSAAEQIEKMLPEQLSIAAINAPDLCVISGPKPVLASFNETLQQQAIDTTHIHIDVAAHSAMLDPILEEFRLCCKSLTWNKPKIPFLSNTTGDWISDEQATDPEYWVSHLRSTINFSACVQRVLSVGNAVFLEVGPGHTLSSLTRANGAKPSSVANAMRHPGEKVLDTTFALSALGSIWSCGATIKWDVLWRHQPARRIALPSYPFQRKRYWVEPGSPQSSTPTAARSNVTPSKLADPSHWHSLRLWQPTGSPAPTQDCPAAWVVFGADHPLTEELISEFDLASQREIRPVMVTASKSFQQITRTEYQIDPLESEHYGALLSQVSQAHPGKLHLVYLWSLDTALVDPLAGSATSVDQQLQRCFWQLFALSKALAETEHPIQLSVIANNLQSVSGEAVEAIKSTLIGPLAVVPREFQNVRTQSIDVPYDSQAGESKPWLSNLSRELLSEQGDKQIALRQSTRYRRATVPTHPPTISGDANWIRPEGTYLISGGLGGIGLETAKFLARHGAGRVILLARSAMPAIDQWAEWLSAHSLSDPTSKKIQQLQKIVDIGAEPVLCQVDLTNETQLADCIHGLLEQYGDIHGVVHAAGSMDDQLVVLKTEASAQQVMGAKIQGALLLDKLLPEAPLDFFIVYSSVASLLGLPGQIDYTAANAFLDAFAAQRQLTKPGSSIAINWNAWAQVGMAVNALQHEQSTDLRIDESYAPSQRLLERKMLTSNASSHFSLDLAENSTWLLEDHVVQGGHATMPGTGFLQLIHAAASDHFKQLSGAATPASIAFQDVSFLAPLQVPSGQVRTLHIVVAPVDANLPGPNDPVEVTLYSESADLPFVTAIAEQVIATAPMPLNVADIQARCTEPGKLRESFLDQDFMAFGPRWGCIESVAYSPSTPEALMVLNLPVEFAEEPRAYPLHPALLDMATGGAQALIPDFKQEHFYVPVRYDSLVCLQPLERSMISHVRLTEANGKFARFDVDIARPSGELLAQIVGFTMQRVEQGSAIAGSGSTNKAGATSQASKAAATLSALLQDAILPDEGMHALNQIMQGETQSQHVVSSVDVHAWEAQLDADVQITGSTLVFEHESSHDPDADPAIEPLSNHLANVFSIEDFAVRSFAEGIGGRRLVLFFAEQEKLRIPELPEINHNLTASDLPTLHWLQPVQHWPTTDIGAGRQTDLEQLQDPLNPVANYVAPTTKTEIALERLWTAVLGSPKIGLGKNFFELGGHSLLLTRLISKVQREFDRKIPLDQAYDSPTIEAWAQLLEAKVQEDAPLKKIGRVNRERFRVK